MKTKVPELPCMDRICECDMCVNNNDNSNRNCPSYIHEVIGHYKNNRMVYLDDMSVCLLENSV